MARATAEERLARLLAVIPWVVENGGATVGEIATFFWGRRPAQMRIAPSGLAHVVVGMDWEQLDPQQLMRLL